MHTPEYRAVPVDPEMGQDLFDHAKKAHDRTNQLDNQVKVLLGDMASDPTIYGEILSNGHLHAVETAFCQAAHVAGIADVPLTNKQLIAFAKERIPLGTLSDQQLLAKILQEIDATQDTYTQFINAYPRIFYEELKTVNNQVETVDAEQ